MTGWMRTRTWCHLQVIFIKVLCHQMWSWWFSLFPRVPYKTCIALKVILKGCYDQYCLAFPAYNWLGEVGIIKLLFCANLLLQKPWIVLNRPVCLSVCNLVFEGSGFLPALPWSFPMYRVLRIYWSMYLLYCIILWLRNNSCRKQCVEMCEFYMTGVSASFQTSAISIQ